MSFLIFVARIVRSLRFSIPNYYNFHLSRMKITKRAQNEIKSGACISRFLASAGQQKNAYWSASSK
jgi:hypothetical protein